ncbi:MAG: putative LPS assembly protein LptD, partial [Bdellovibrionota bacterium]
STFTIGGDVLRKVDSARYLISHGEFTTCRDCPQSWTFGGDEIDAEFDQYAYISNVVVRVKDAPVAWAPYFIIPLKRTRQSGFLFPGIGVVSPLGMTFLVPYFFALHRSADMTLTAGIFSARGPRAQWEGRYQISPLTYGNLNVHYLRDNDEQFSATRVRSRWSLLGKQSIELPYDTSVRMSFVEVGDNLYPTSGMGGDIAWDGHDTLMSDVAIMNTTRYAQSYLMFRRLRGVGYSEVIGTTTDAAGNPVELRRPTGFNPNVVQLLPVFHTATGERVIMDSPVSAGLSTTVHNFTRTGESFDCEDPNSLICGAKVSSLPVFTPGVDPVRKTLRTTLVPSLSTSFRPGGAVTVAPSLQYRTFFYRFPTDSGLKPLNRGYLLYQTDISMQAERIFELNGAEVKKIKHLFRPNLTYSLIPFQYQPESHPLVQQIERNPAYKFDAYDVVPYGSTNDYVSYFVPLGHSLSYGVTTQLIRKHKPENGGEFNTNPLSLSAGQTFNFRELGKGNPKLFSRMHATIGAGLGAFSLGGNYYFYPYFREESGGKSPHSFIGNVTWTLKPAPGGGDRYVKVSYVHEEAAGNTHSLDEELVYSLFGFLRPTIGTRYDILTKTFPAVNSSLIFQNPGNC